MVIRPADAQLEGQALDFTGGAGAIGLATARMALAAVADVALIDRDEQVLDRVVVAGAARTEIGRPPGPTALERGLTCPHHTDHGVGAAAQEPRGSCPATKRFSPRAWSSRSSPARTPTVIGVRIEHLVLVGPDGPDILTTHSIDLT